MKISIPALVAAAFLLGAAYSPTSPASPWQGQASAANDQAIPSFEDLDKTHRGFLTRADIPKDVEALKPLRMHLADSDANGNGRLEKSEYGAYVAKVQASNGQSTTPGTEHPAPKAMH
ncbi:hypothetical protein [Rhodanobacter sp. L36]|uniref:hypothetical protein n=1 Tax=Rhodanobacter sp. L36 TaxID=1747221 RepID=UPI00131DC5E1|nr:hypothetical protein [Rhodanobacter sp. L36]